MINIVNNYYMQTLVIWLHPYTRTSGATVLNEGVLLSLGLITEDFYLLFTVDLGL